MAEDTTSHPRNPPRPVTLAKGPPRPVTVSKAPLGKITLSTRAQRPVTLAKGTPREVSKAGPERPVTLAKGPTREATTPKGPERPVTLAKAPERPVTLASKPPRDVTLAKGPERPVTIAKGPQREVTLAKAPQRPVTLAKGPERPVTLSKGPERPVTLAKGPERPVTLPKRPPGPVTLPIQPERPVTLARRDQRPPPAPAPQTQPPAQPRRIITQRLSPQKPKQDHKIVKAKSNLQSTLPTPDAFCQIEGFAPFPAKWERWLSAVREGILSSQPVAGRHVTVDVHEGMGTVVNVADNRRPTSAITCAAHPNIILTASEMVICAGCECGTDMMVQFGPVSVSDLGVNITYPQFPLNPIIGFPNFWSSDVAGAPPMPNVVHAVTYTGTCDDGCVTESGSSDEQIAWNVFCDSESGLWYVNGNIGDLGIFYGFGSDPSHITNNIFVCGALYSVPPPLGTGGPGADFMSIGGSGFVSISLP